MKLVDSFDAMVARMTQRERRLFLVLAAAACGTVLVAIFLAMSAVFGSIQDEIDHGRTVMAEARALEPRYKELSDQKKAIEDAIRGNKSTARSLVNDLLKRQSMSSDVPGALGDTLADIVSFEGKTTDTPVEVGKSRKKAAKGKSKESATGIVQIEHGLEFKEVPSADLLSLLDQVEQGKEILFVTRLDLARKFNNMEHVRAQVTVATFQFQGGGGGGDETPAAATEASGATE
jgi:hypothetical protein